MNMRIKGSNNKYYEVNLSEVTCSCRDWTCRRHNFNKMDDRRLCKHLITAKSIMSSLDYTDNPPKLDKEVIVDKFTIGCINNILHSSDKILKYSICGEVYRGSSVIKEYIPIVVVFINDNISSAPIMDSILRNSNIFLYEGSNMKRYYDGNLPIMIIPSTIDSFVFQSIYYDLTMDEFMTLSSVAYNKLGLRMTRLGFIDKDNKLINIKVSTNQEICDLLNLDRLR